MSRSATTDPRIKRLASRASRSSKALAALEAGEAERHNGGRRRRCAWVLALAVPMAAGVGVGIWRILLTDEAKDDIVSVLDGTLEDLRNYDDAYFDGGATGDYQFMQCEPTRRCCNGLESICDLPVNKVLFAGVHNAMATREDGFLLLPNHDERLEDALEAGYRAINLDVASCDGELRLVHGSCWTGSRDPTTAFANVQRFLDENPSEIVLLTLQIETDAALFGGGEDVTLDDLDALFARIDGLKDRFYGHPVGETDWPTLQDLIDADRRIIFAHYNGNERCARDGCPPAFHDWFDVAVESEFDFESIDAVKNTAESCRITRGNINANGFWGINVFVTPPSRSAARELNDLAFLQNQIEECSALNEGRDLNVVFVDFWRQGDLPEAVQLHNRALGADPGE